MYNNYTRIKLIIIAAFLLKGACLFQDSNENKLEYTAFSTGKWILYLNCSDDSTIANNVTCHSNGHWSTLITCALSGN